MVTRESRIALVSGGNRGIGLEVCRQLGRAGLRVLLGARDLDAGHRAAEKLAREGVVVRPVWLDVVRGEDVDAVKALVEARYGRLDVLVNNAGVYLDEGVSVFKVDEQIVRETLDVNFYGAFRLCRAFLPMMQANGYGRVVNVSSGYGSVSEMGGRNAAYKVSKAALNALTRILAAEVEPAQVKVNAVCPGWVKTQMGGVAAQRSVEQGAETIVWLATLDDDGPSSGFFRDQEPIPW